MATRKTALSAAKPKAASYHPTAHGISTQAGMPDRVWASFGVTMNLGDYSSARIDSGMSSDVAEDESSEQAFERVQDYAQQEVRRLSADVRSEMNGAPMPFKKKSR